MTRSQRRMCRSWVLGVILAKIWGDYVVTGDKVLVQGMVYGMLSRGRPAS